MMIGKSWWTGMDRDEGRAWRGWSFGALRVELLDFLHSVAAGYGRRWISLLVF